MGNVLSSALQRNAAPARVPRVFLAFGRPTAERRSALAQSACLTLILSPHVWEDEACMADLAEAARQGKQILLVQVCLTPLPCLLSNVSWVLKIARQLRLHADRSLI